MFLLCSENVHQTFEIEEAQDAELLRWGAGTRYLQVIDLPQC